MPIDMTVEVYYDEARTRMLSFHCSFCHPFRQWIEIVGEKKTLSLKDFVLAAAPSSCEFVVEHSKIVILSRFCLLRVPLTPKVSLFQTLG